MWWVVVEGLAELGNGLAAEDADLEGALHVAGVVSIDGGGGGGVEGGEAFVEFVEGKSVEFFAESFVAGGEVGGAVGEEFDVEAGATDDDGEFSA